MCISEKPMCVEIPYPDVKGKADIARWRKKYDSVKIEWLREVFEEIGIPLPEWCEKEGIIGAPPYKKLEVFRVLKEHNVSGMQRDWTKLKDFLVLSQGEYKYCTISGPKSEPHRDEKDDKELSRRLDRIEDMMVKILALLQSQNYTSNVQTQPILLPTQKKDRTREILRVVHERWLNLIVAGVQKDPLKAYILRVTGAGNTNIISPSQWDKILTHLESLLIKKGTDAVNSFIAPVPKERKATELSPDFMQADTSIDLNKFKKQLTKLVD